MSDVNWRELKKITIPAKPVGVWTVACEYLTATRKLKIEAEGTWSYGQDLSCSPDGDVGSPRSCEKCLSNQAPIGALIGKLGGSSAGIKDTVITIGRFCVIELTEAAKGPLFLTINDEPAGLSDNTGEVTVHIYSAP